MYQDEGQGNSTPIDSVAARSSHGTYHAQARAAGKEPAGIATASSTSASPDANASTGTAEHGVTVRSGYVYELGQTDALSRDALERAQRLHGELESLPERGIEGRPVYRAVKRLFDIAFSLAVIVFLSPMFLAVAVAIKVDDPEGPVFFRQERVGRFGETFRMYKFRSMVADAEERLKDLRDLNEKDGPAFKIREDPRITRVGRFIRKTSIDEFPQFINVLLGQMSVVGPRPALPREVAQYTDYQRQRLLMKPGITCYWQTRRNRDSIGFDEWVDLDLLYIRKCSVWSDFKLIVQTVGVVLTMQGS